MLKHLCVVDEARSHLSREICAKIRIRRGENTLHNPFLYLLDVKPTLKSHLKTVKLSKLGFWGVGVLGFWV